MEKKERRGRRRRESKRGEAEREKITDRGEREREVSGRRRREKRIEGDETIRYEEALSVLSYTNGR